MTEEGRPPEITLTDAMLAAGVAVLEKHEVEGVSEDMMREAFLEMLATGLAVFVWREGDVP